VSRARSQVSRRSPALRPAEAGQALVESSILAATVLGVVFGGGWYLLRTQPDMMNALSIYVHGFYYMLSLPIP
jgi:hypothetical protein